MATSIPIIFDNQSGKTVYLQFLNGAFGPGQTGASGAVSPAKPVSLAGDTAYDIADLSSPVPGFTDLRKVPNVSLNDFTNGRIYFNYGSQGLQNLGSGYQPNPVAPADPNYNTRYAFVELNVTGDQNNNLDLSAIDFFGMPIKASTWRGGKQVGELKSADGGTIIKALTPLSTGTQAFVPSKPTAPYTGFARILGPGLVPGYHDWSDYMNYLAGIKDGPTNEGVQVDGSHHTKNDKHTMLTRVAGVYGGQQGGTGPTARHTYDLTADFDATKKVVTLKGNITPASSNTPSPTTIAIKFSDLNALTGAYGANPPYTINGTTTTTGIVNDVYGWIVGDLLAGLNMGFPGSNTKDPITGKPLGECTSSEWFAAAKKHRTLQFSAVQSNSSYYNRYADAVLKHSDAYGFPFSDRAGDMLLYFPPSGAPGAVDYLKITFLPDEELPLAG
jgi:hypothetical protein